MELLTEREQIRTVASRWKARNVDRNGRLDKLKQEIFERLSGIDVETASAISVAEIIGSSGWVSKQMCDECETNTWDCVRLGEPPDYDSATAIVCVSCLRAALKLIGADSWER